MTLCVCVSKEETAALKAMTASLTTVHLEEGSVPALKASSQTLSGSSINTILATYVVQDGALEETNELSPVGATPQAALVLVRGKEYSTHGSSMFSHHKLLVFVKFCRPGVENQEDPLPK